MSGTVDKSIGLAAHPEVVLDTLAAKPVAPVLFDDGIELGNPGSRILHEGDFHFGSQLAAGQCPVFDKHWIGVFGLCRPVDIGVQPSFGKPPCLFPFFDKSIGTEIPGRSHVTRSILTAPVVVKHATDRLADEGVRHLFVDLLLRNGEALDPETGETGAPVAVGGIRGILGNIFESMNHLEARRDIAHQADSFLENEFGCRSHLLLQLQTLPRFRGFRDDERRLEGILDSDSRLSAAAADVPRAIQTESQCIEFLKGGVLIGIEVACVDRSDVSCCSEQVEMYRESPLFIGENAAQLGDCVHQRSTAGAASRRACDVDGNIQRSSHAQGSPTISEGGNQVLQVVPIGERKATKASNLVATVWLIGAADDAVNLFPFVADPWLDAGIALEICHHIAETLRSQQDFLVRSQADLLAKNSPFVEVSIQIVIVGIHAQRGNADLVLHAAEIVLELVDVGRKASPALTPPFHEEKLLQFANDRASRAAKTDE